jgi:hypothetical protein
MLPRILLAAAALGVLGAPAETLRYKIEVKSGQQMDMTSLGQGAIDIKLTSSSWVSITSRDSAGQQLLHVVVDSTQIDAAGLPDAVDPAMMQVAKGTVLDLAIVGGKLQGITPETIGSSPGMGFVVAGIALLYPPAMRAGVKVGDSWTDTVTTDTTTAIGKGTSTQIRQWKASAKEGDAMVFDNTFTGTMTLGGGMADVSGTTKGTNHIIIGSKGPALKASTEGTTNMTMSISAAPSPIQMVATNAVTVTPIK